MNKFQDFTIDSSLGIVQAAIKYNLSILKSTNNYSVKSGIDRYCQTYNYKGKDRCIYIKNFKLSDRANPIWYSKVLFSKEALKIFMDPNLSATAVQNLLHGEHITPMSQVMRRLQICVDNNITDRDKVAETFRDSKYIIITAQERDILDKAGSTYTDLFMQDFCSKYSVNDPLNILNEAILLNNKSTKSYGPGILRMYYLNANGVEFVDINNNIQSSEDWINYLNDNNYIIEEN